MSIIRDGRCTITARKAACTFLPLVLAALPLASASGQEFTEVIGREVSVFNDLVNPVFPSDVASRKVSVLNDLVNPAEPVDAVSREITVMKYTAAVTSNATARALPLDASLVLPDQLAALNMPPPAVDPFLWMPVQRKNVNMAETFECNQAPDPLLEGYVISDEYLLQADEVTFDNCGSAWYRFTFVLPQDVSDASMLGRANVTQQGVLYLNGAPVSGMMNVPPCLPFMGPDDPCYAAQDTGSDVQDMLGLPILTSPTPDLFGTDDPSLFVPGLNELVFGVAGDASFYDPTGLEFEAFLFHHGTAPCGGDLDDDADVDLADFDQLQLCLTGADIPATAECAFADLDSDGDVDLSDFALFQGRFAQACP